MSMDLHNLTQKRIIHISYNGSVKKKETPSLTFFDQIVIVQNVSDDGRVITFQRFNVIVRSVADSNQALQGALQEMFVVALQ